MAVLSVVATSDITSAAAAIYRRYQQEYREFITVMKRCWLKGWPDRKDAIDCCCVVAYAYGEQALMRLDHLLRNDLLKSSVCGSVGDIHHRLFDNWSEAEESALVTSNPAYKESLAAREAAQARIRPEDTEEPAKMAKSDPEYVKAGEKISNVAWHLNEELKELMTSSQT
jgi:hypothetical protein